jgi:hypothetical protein
MVPPAGAIERSRASSQAVAVRELFKQVFHRGPVPSERAAMRPLPGVATSWVSQAASTAAREQPTSKMPE